MKFRLFFFLLFLISCSTFPVETTANPLPPLIVPDSLGVNIHFTNPRPGEMKMISELGVKWIRMDLFWDQTEKEKGVYDFSAYDHLFEVLERHGLKAVMILDYGSGLYPGGNPPTSPEGIQAFVNWATQAVQRYQGKGVLWEIWNEPNVDHFWPPKADVEAYIKLAKAVSAAIKKVAPQEAVVGPGSSHIPLDFLERIFQSGLLEHWSAITVHPYRNPLKSPETSIQDIAELRTLLKKYLPPGKDIPVLSGEWGYSSSPFLMDDEKQAKFLARMWLINLANGIPLSIWYDWHDDGPDLDNSEHNFGVVEYPYLEGQDPVYTLKPGYLAAQTLIENLKGFEFRERVFLGSFDDYILKFQRGEEIAWAVWSTKKAKHTVEIPTGPGSYEVTKMKGQKSKTMEVKGNFLTLSLYDSPRYIRRK